MAELTREESLPASKRATVGVCSHTRIDSNPTRHKAGVKIALTLMLATLFALDASELLLRLVWHNPYRFEVPDHILKVRIHHPNTDQIFSRALVNPEQPMGQLRTDGRSYIIPSFQFKDPDATVAFLGGSTTECSAVQEDSGFQHSHPRY